MNKRQESGFTLIELMIVVEILSIIAVMAIPTLLRQRIQTNEAAAVQNLRVISTAQISFNTVNLKYGTFDELCAGVGSTPYLDGTWVQNGGKGEYIFAFENLTNDTFTATAVPEYPGTTGLRKFSVDESGVITMESAMGG